MIEPVVSGQNLTRIILSRSNDSRTSIVTTPNTMIGSAACISFYQRRDLSRNQTIASAPVQIIDDGNNGKSTTVLQIITIWIKMTN